MDLKSYLDQIGLPYEWSIHADAFTARGLASREHIPAERVIKPVLIKVDGEYVLCALPASYQINLQQLQMELGAAEATLADEADLSSLCCNCEVGAEPPIGWLFGIPTFMDESLFDDERVTFQAGTHRDAVTMSFLDYYRLAKPVIGHFGHHRQPTPPPSTTNGAGKAQS